MTLYSMFCPEHIKILERLQEFYEYDVKKYYIQQIVEQNLTPDQSLNYILFEHWNNEHELADLEE